MDHINREYKFYGEWVTYSNDEEKENAKNYLSLWKKFILKKLSSLEFVEEKLIDRPSSTLLESTLGLKIVMCTLKNPKTLDEVGSDSEKQYQL